MREGSIKILGTRVDPVEELKPLCSLVNRFLSSFLSPWNAVFNFPDILSSRVKQTALLFLANDPIG